MTCTYEIWRIQHYLNTNCMKYNKINSISKIYFQSDNHNTMESAKKEADRYIKYIKNETNHQLSTGLDRIYIINSNDTVEYANVFQSSYYNMWKLLDLEHPRLDFQPKPRSKKDLNTYPYFWNPYFWNTCVVIRL